MGMYTELFLALDLRTGTPREVLDTLGVMVGGEEPEGYRPPNHPLFRTDRWDYMLCADGLLAPYSPPTLRESAASGCYELCVHSSFKNYDGEIAKFLDWLAPHIAARNPLIGYHRYEECAAPTLLYLDGEGKIVAQYVPPPPGVEI